MNCWRAIIFQVHAVSILAFIFEKHILHFICAIRPLVLLFRSSVSFCEKVNSNIVLLFITLVQVQSNFPVFFCFSKTESFLWSCNKKSLSGVLYLNWFVSEFIVSINNFGRLSWPLLNKPLFRSYQSLSHQAQTQSKRHFSNHFTSIESMHLQIDLIIYLNTLDNCPSC